ncbi:SDR family oxidoreductase [Nocardia sp. 004]|uniref:SDR family oxidoreductase n=1 Tax=Nocardia sp. 004 TaxID=3385978 RepID=UPI0039A0E332
MSAITDRKTVLITGTSSGIGLHAAVLAAESGWQVVATMRQTARSTALDELANQNGVADRIDIRPLDVTDPASVQACLSGVLADHGRLDAVINNAGAGHLGTLEMETIADIRAVMEVNFFGVLEVTRAALPHVRAARGRVLTVTSVGGVVGHPYNEAYCAAKFAVEGFMESLAPAVKSLGVTVSVLEPAAVTSQFVDNVDSEKLTVDSAGPYAPGLSAYLEYARNAYVDSGAQTSESAAQAVVDALDAVDLPFRVQTSDAARKMVAIKLSDLDGSKVQGLAEAYPR